VRFARICRKDSAFSSGSFTAFLLSAGAPIVRSAPEVVDENADNDQGVGQVMSTPYRMDHFGIITFVTAMPRLHPVNRVPAQ
jgi:hypothetical protein